MDSTPTTVPNPPAPEPTVEVSLSIVIKMPEEEVEDFLKSIDFSPARKSRRVRNGISISVFGEKTEISSIKFDGIDL